MELVTAPIVLNTCPRCDGSGRIVTKATILFRDAFYCPVCKAKLQLTQRHYWTRMLLFAHSMIGWYSLMYFILKTKDATPAGTCLQIASSVLIWFAIFKLPTYGLRIELYRRWQFSVRTLVLMALDVSAMLCALVTGNSIPLAIASCVAVWLARRQDSSTQPLAN